MIILIEQLKSFKCDKTNINSGLILFLIEQRGKNPNQINETQFLKPGQLPKTLKVFQGVKQVGWLVYRPFFFFQFTPSDSLNTQIKLLDTG